MKRVFLHIGTHKTGTTAIQKFLANAEGQLQKDGILYPRSGRPEVEHGAQYGHHLLAWAIREKKGINHLNDWERTLEELKAAEQQTIVLSSEDFETCTEEQIAHIDTLLEDFDVHIVLYLRNPFDFLVSAYKQNIKSGKYAGSFGDFVERRGHRCNYTRLVERWVDRFGVDHFHAMAFDKYRSRCRVEQSFLDLLGLEVERYEAYMQSPANVSPSDQQIALIRKINAVEAAWGRSMFWERVRRNVLDKRKVGSILLALMTPFLDTDLFEIDDLNSFKKSVNDMNRALLENGFMKEEWKYIKC